MNKKKKRREKENDETMPRILPFGFIRSLRSTKLAGLFSRRLRVKKESFPRTFVAVQSTMSNLFRTFHFFSSSLPGHRMQITNAARCDARARDFPMEKVTSVKSMLHVSNIRQSYTKELPSYSSSTVSGTSRTRSAIFAAHRVLRRINSLLFRATLDRSL